MSENRAREGTFCTNFTLSEVFVYTKSVRPYSSGSLFFFKNKYFRLTPGPLAACYG